MRSWDMHQLLKKEDFLAVEDTGLLIRSLAIVCDSSDVCRSLNKTMHWRRIRFFSNHLAHFSQDFIYLKKIETHLVSLLLWRTSNQHILLHFSQKYLRQHVHYHVSFYEPFWRHTYIKSEITWRLDSRSCLISWIWLCLLIPIQER